MIAIQTMDVMEPKELMLLAKEKGKEFRQIKTHQIRNFYKEVNGMKLDLQQLKKKDKVGEAVLLEKLYERLIFLQPKLAYAAGRKLEVKGFYEFIEKVIDKMDEAEDKKKAMENFIVLIESVVAYHKFFGGN